MNDLNRHPIWGFATAAFGFICCILGLGFAGGASVPTYATAFGFALYVVGGGLFAAVSLLLRPKPKRLYAAEHFIITVIDFALLAFAIIVAMLFVVLK